MFKTAHPPVRPRPLRESHRRPFHRGNPDSTKPGEDQEERLVDIILWVERDVPTDPTMEFGPDHCDVIVQNRGTLSQFEERLRALCREARLGQ